MPCCGQKRAQATNSQTRTAQHPSLPLAPTDPGSELNNVPLRYLANTPVMVRGPVTGTPYYFSDAQRVLRVQLVDAEGLLKTQFFRRAEPVMRQ